MRHEVEERLQEDMEPREILLSDRYSNQLLDSIDQKVCACLQYIRTTHKQTQYTEGNNQPPYRPLHIALWPLSNTPRLYPYYTFRYFRLDDGPRMLVWMGGCLRASLPGSLWQSPPKTGTWWFSSPMA